VFFEPLGDTVRLRVAGERASHPRDTAYQLALFDRATARLRRREPELLAELGGNATRRGWRREDLYDRGLSR
jgi:hypothetical protein